MAHDSRVSHGAVINEDPDDDDYGMVVRPIPTAAGLWDTDQVTVGLAAVQILPLLAQRKAVSFRVSCTGGAEIFFGNSSAVTILTGTGLKDRETISIELDAQGEVWAIATAVGQIVYVSETGLG